MLIPDRALASADRVFWPSMTHTFTPMVSKNGVTSLSMMSSSNDFQSIAIPVALSIARGGAELFTRANGGGLDMGRVRMRLEGLQAYATLCALLTNGCLRLYSSVNVPKAEKQQGDKWVQRSMDVFLLSIVVSVLFGSYTTIVFSLLALYSKTALGRGYDDQFLEFFAATAELRESGFRSFLYSLLSFELAFIMSLVLRFQGARRKKLVLSACLITSLSIWRWSTIMRLAGKYLFPLRAEVQY